MASAGVHLTAQLGTALALIVTDRIDAICIVVADFEVVHVYAQTAAHSKWIDRAIVAFGGVTLSKLLFDH